MNPVGRALWFIESHFTQALSLDEIALAGGVSKYHMTRAFRDATGSSVVRYLRSRRLTEAARALAKGATDILAVAIEAGYSSHEAFTRAFRDQFGLTPEAVRDRQNTQGITLMEPLKMDETLLAKLESPRMEKGRRFLIAGLGERYTCESAAGIPAQWQRFIPHIGHLPTQVGGIAYGVCCNCDDAGNFEYISGVEVSDFSSLPAEFRTVTVPEQTYAVFTHRGHISEIRRTWSTIWSQWLPDSKFDPVNAPDFERYDENFDSATGMGGLEIWVPIKPKAP
jgi:AraC family transcriptional regulator